MRGYLRMVFGFGVAVLTTAWVNNDPWWAHAIAGACIGLGAHGWKD